MLPSPRLPLPSALVPLFTAAALLALALPAAAESFVTFQIPGSSALAPVKVNSQGVVAGAYTAAGRQHGFVRSADGQITSFDVDGFDTTPTSLNDDGSIVGYYNDGDTLRAFQRSADGTITAYLPQDGFAVPYAINKTGGVAGFYRQSQNQDLTNLGFVATAGGGFATIDLQPQTTGSVAVALNDRGDAAGHFENTLLHTGFVRKANGTLVLFKAGSSNDDDVIPQTEAVGLNNAGVATGVYKTVVCPWSCSTKTSQGFVRNATGKLTLFSVGGKKGFTTVTAINNAGQVTGSYSTRKADGGFLRQADGSVLTFQVPGMHNTEPSSVNDQGVVTGRCLDANSRQLGFIRQP